MSKRHRYLLALGSNRRHARFGRPERVLVEAASRLAELGRVYEVAPFLRSDPVGPSSRDFVNTALVLGTALEPLILLRALKGLEREFGRSRAGQRWRDRVLDCDIVLWSGGAWSTADLTIPHPLFRQRRFVLEPAVAIAADWCDPVTGLTLRQLKARLTRPRPLPR